MSTTKVASGTTRSRVTPGTLGAAKVEMSRRARKLLRDYEDGARLGAPEADQARRVAEAESIVASIRASRVDGSVVR